MGKIVEDACSALHLHLLYVQLRYLISYGAIQKMLSAALLTPPPHQVNIKPTFPGITPQHLVIQIQYKPTVRNALEFITMVIAREDGEADETLSTL